MKKQILFRNLWNGSLFVHNNRPYRKQCEARSVDLLSGKDSIFLGKDIMQPISQETMFNLFHIKY